jgi:serine/threonine protein kinase
MKPMKLMKHNINELNIKIMKQIGQGSFGKVFYVLETTSGRPIAMKQLSLPNFETSFHVSQNSKSDKNITTPKHAKHKRHTNIQNSEKNILKNLQLEIDFLSKLNHEKM